MPKVYVPHVPSRYDSTVKAWVPTVDLSKAERFGEIVVLLKPDTYRLAISQLIPGMKEKMRGFGPTDYIVALGDPSVIAAAAMIASSMNGGQILMLKWDRNMGDYLQLGVQV